MSVNLLSEDIGYLYNKSVANGVPHIYKSIVGTGRSLSLSDLNMNHNSSEDYIVCKFDDESYFVSDLATKESDTIFYSLKEDRFQELAVDVITRCSMGIGLGAGFHECYVVSGLPLQQYKKFKGNISNLFMPESTTVHEYEISYRLKDGMSDLKTIKGGVRVLDARFIPQPFGALLNEVLDDSGKITNRSLAKQTVAVIDIGFGTADIYVSSALEPVEKLSFSSKTAMNSAYKLIAGKILDTWEVDEPLYKIENVVTTGFYKRLGKSYDMSKVIEWAMSSVADTLTSEIFTKWRTSSSIDSFLLAGGGGLRLNQYISKEFDNINICKDGQWAISKGYSKWGKRTWKDTL